MKYRYTAWYFRLLAFVLAAICLGIGFLSGIATVYCAVEDYYFEEDHSFQTTWRCAEAVRNKGWRVIEQFQRDPDYDKWDKLLSNTDLRFIIMDEENGEVVASYTEGLGLQVPDNMAGNPYLYEYNTNLALGVPGTFLETVYVCDYYFGTDFYGNAWGSFSSDYKVGVMENKHSYQILYLLPIALSTHTGDGIWEASRCYWLFVAWSGVVPVIFAVCTLLFLAALIFLLVTAGRRPEQEALCSGWVEKIPMDVLLALAVLVGIGVIGAVVLTADVVGSSLVTVREVWIVGSLGAAGAAVCGTVIIAILRSAVVRLRLRCFWKSMWTVQLLSWMLGLVQKLLAPLGHLAIRGIRSIGLVPRAGLGTIGVFFVEFWLLVWLVNAWEPVFPLVALIFFNLAVLFAILWGFGQLKLLQKAAETLADGALENQLDTSGMYWDFKRHGERLNAIADGMNKAVEQRMKSERLKTELITNVSHDIKTPLTSIVNYVDLLQKPHTEAEGIQYLEVLDRQSKRLKKLTENLVEASKASTGNLTVELEPTSVMELLNQAVEEYRERLDAGKLEVVMDLRGEMTVLADGKHMWRILDNLLNNVVKYALAGTRVYVTAEQRENRVVLAVKNISRDPLNISADELMERFVRGDASRTTEGSGLGLNIARSLTLLQNGTFDLTVDGDFFKAEIALPAVR